MGVVCERWVTDFLPPYRRVAVAGRGVYRTTAGVWGKGGV